MISLLVLMAELGFTVLGPLAESREPVSMGLHIDGPKPYCASHNAATCVVCLAMQAPTLPSQPHVAPRTSVFTKSSSTFDVPTCEYELNRSAPVARGPPILG